MKVLIVFDIHANWLRHKLLVPLAQLFQELRVYLNANLLRLHALGLIPGAHLGQHFGSFEAVGCASLRRNEGEPSDHGDGAMTGRP
jgi:hypothetical protein